MTGPVPPRVDAHVKAGLLELIDHATERGWSLRRAAELLGLDEVRAARWRARRTADALNDRARAGHRATGCSTGNGPRSSSWDRPQPPQAGPPRLPAGPGARQRVHRAPGAGVEGLVVPGHPARDPAPRAPWPDWLEWKPNRIWAYDFTHFTRARRAVIAILDVVTRRWITTLVAAEESSTQVEVAFTTALVAEDLLTAADAAATEALRTALACGERERLLQATTSGQVPLLLAISNNGPQMRSHSTREFLAGVAIAQQFGRPTPPTTRPGSSRACGTGWPRPSPMRATPASG